MTTPLIEHRARKTVPCRSCRRPVTRSTVLRRTQDLGAAVSIEKICLQLRDEAARWQPENDLCATCATTDKTTQENRP